MIDGLSTLPSVRLRHAAAPLLAEREQYLRQLSMRGLCRVTIRVTAAYMLHVIRVMKFIELRNVTIEEIEEAGKVWATYVGPERRCHLEGKTNDFTRVAKHWFTFAGCLARPPLPPFTEHLEQYAQTLEKIQGRAPATIDSYRKSVAAFFRHVNARHTGLDTIRLSEIHEYLDKLRSHGQKNSSIASQCNALRSFFKHAEIMGWCSSGIPFRDQESTDRSVSRSSARAWMERCETAGAPKEASRPERVAYPRHTADPRYLRSAQKRSCEIATERL